MNNKQAVMIANQTSNDYMKKTLRNSFQKWCKDNNRTPMNPLSMEYWFECDYKDGIIND